jgi:hypothetical protein
MSSLLPILAATIASTAMVAIFLLIGRAADRAKAKRENAIYGRPYQERAADAAKLIMACLPRDRYAPDAQATVTFYTDETNDPKVSAFSLNLPDGEIATFHATVTQNILRLLAPDMGSGNYRVINPSQASETVVLSANPHDLNQEDLVRIARLFQVFPPIDSQLFKLLEVPRRRFQKRNVVLLRQPS